MKPLINILAYQPGQELIGLTDELTIGPQQKMILNTHSNDPKGRQYWFPFLLFSRFVQDLFCFLALFDAFACNGGNRLPGICSCLLVFSQHPAGDCFRSSCGRGISIYPGKFLGIQVCKQIDERSSYVCNSCYRFDIIVLWIDYTDGYLPKTYPLPLQTAC